MFANIYLHYVLDVWFEEELKPLCKGEAFLIRHADDFVTAFRFHKDAMRFYRKLGKHLKEYSLKLSERKTRKILFSRFWKEESKAFTFLGFTFRWTRARRGFDTVTTKMSREKIRRLVKEFSLWCKEHRNKRVA